MSKKTKRHLTRLRIFKHSSIHTFEHSSIQTFKQKQKLDQN